MIKIKTLLTNFFLAPSEGRVLSALRVVVGGAIFIKVLWIFPHLENLFGQHGYLQANLMEKLMGANLASWLAQHEIVNDRYTLILYSCFTLQLVSAFCFCLGFCTRVFGILLWVTQGISFHLGWASSYGVDSYLYNITFLMLWLPVNRFYALDGLWLQIDRQKSSLCTLGLRCLQFYLLATYIDAGFSKAQGIDWWDGAAIWKTLNTPYWNHFDFHWLAEIPWVAKALSIGTIIIEGFYIIGAWIPKIGKLWVLSIVGMHLGIAVIMGLYFFGTVLALLSATLFLFPMGKRDLAVSS